MSAANATARLTKCEPVSGSHNLLAVTQGDALARYHARYDALAGIGSP